MEKRDLGICYRLGRFNGSPQFERLLSIYLKTTEDGWIDHGLGHGPDEFCIVPVYILPGQSCCFRFCMLFYVCFSSKGNKYFFFDIWTNYIILFIMMKSFIERKYLLFHDVLYNVSASYEQFSKLISSALLPTY